MNLSHGLTNDASNTCGNSSFVPTRQQNPLMIHTTVKDVASSQNHSFVFGSGGHSLREAISDSLILSSDSNSKKRNQKVERKKKGKKSAHQHKKGLHSDEDYLPNSEMFPS